MFNWNMLKQSRKEMQSSWTLYWLLAVDDCSTNQSDSWSEKSKLIEPPTPVEVPSHFHHCFDQQTWLFFFLASHKNTLRTESNYISLVGRRHVYVPAVFGTSFFRDWFSYKLAATGARCKYCRVPRWADDERVCVCASLSGFSRKKEILWDPVSPSLSPQRKRERQHLFCSVPTSVWGFVVSKCRLSIHVTISTPQLWPEVKISTSLCSNYFGRMSAYFSSEPGSTPPQWQEMFILLVGRNQSFPTSRAAAGTSWSCSGGFNFHTLVFNLMNWVDYF